VSGEGHAVPSEGGPRIRVATSALLIILRVFLLTPGTPGDTIRNSMPTAPTC